MMSNMLKRTEKFAGYQNLNIMAIGKTKKNTKNGHTEYILITTV